MRQTGLLLAALFVISPTAANAVPVTIDFTSGAYSDELGSADSNPDTYSQDGFKFQVLSAGNHIDPGFGPDGGSLIFHNNGTNPTFDNDVALTFGGALFDVISFDIIDVFGFNAVDVTPSGGGTVSFNSLGTKLLNFVGITSLVFSTPGDVGDFPTIDNIVVQATSVPEPGSLALLGIGLFGLGLARRRRQS